MKLFTINEESKMSPYQELDYPKVKSELDLEILLENNPEYFFEESNVLIIGRQVSTNLNSIIDLLGVDKAGNTVVVELKRGKTPRETVAQLLEYASFVENLDYPQLNEIYRNHTDEENSLEEAHQQYFQNDIEENVSFNKSARLIIVAQNVSPGIKQTSLFLRKKGIDFYCMEFKYFETKSGEKIISSDFVVGEEDYIPPKFMEKIIDEEIFLQSLDRNGFDVFQRVFAFGRQHGLTTRWGYKGFSMNVPFGSQYVGVFQGYISNSQYKQSIICKFSPIEKKVRNADDIISFYKTKIRDLGFFKATSYLALKWDLDRPYPEDDVEKFLGIVGEVVEKIRERGLK